MCVDITKPAKYACMYICTPCVQGVCLTSCVLAQNVIIKELNVLNLGEIRTLKVRVCLRDLIMYSVIYEYIIQAQSLI